MNLSATTVGAHRDKLSAIVRNVALMLDDRTGLIRVPLRAQQHRAGDEPSVAYRVDTLMATATVAVTGVVHLTLQDLREPECMPLLVEQVKDEDEAGRLLAILVGAILAPDKMWSALNRAAWINLDTDTPLPDQVCRADSDGFPLADWTDDPMCLLEHVTGPLCYEPEPGVVGRFVRAAKVTPFKDDRFPFPTE